MKFQRPAERILEIVLDNPGRLATDAKMRATSTPIPTVSVVHSWRKCRIGGEWVMSGVSPSCSYFEKPQHRNMPHRASYDFAKDHPLRVAVGLIGGKQARAILSQMRVIDTKRLVRKIEYLDADTFEQIRKAAKGML